MASPVSAHSIKFIFSDETGEYRVNMSKKARKQNPYYVRGSLLIDALDYKELVPYIREVKNKHAFDETEEIKYSDIWNWKHDRKGDKDKATRGMEYVEDCLSCLSDIESVLYIFTVTYLNNLHYVGDEVRLLKWHLLDLMQRIHFVLRPNRAGEDIGYASIFLDMLNKKHCEALRAAYHQISSGEEEDFVAKYSTIKDSITFEDSRHSIGIQMADIISGVFHGCLCNREFSAKCSREFLQGKIRRYNNMIFGYGVMEVPTSEFYRNSLRTLWQERMEG